MGEKQAPERIYARVGGHEAEDGIWSGIYALNGSVVELEDDQTEYVRVDIHAAEIAKRDAEIVALAKKISALYATCDKREAEIAKRNEENERLRHENAGLMRMLEGQRIETTQLRAALSTDDANTGDTRAKPLPPGVVEVCPICDIAGCKHIRERTMQTLADEGQAYDAGEVRRRALEEAESDARAHDCTDVTDDPIAESYVAGYRSARDQIADSIHALATSPQPATDDVRRRALAFSTHDIEQLSEIAHNAYETAAIEHGWATNEASRVPWSEVPTQNKATTRAAVSAILSAIATPPQPAPTVQEAAMDLGKIWGAIRSGLTMNVEKIGKAIGGRDVSYEMGSAILDEVAQDITDRIDRLSELQTERDNG